MVLPFPETEMPGAARSPSRTAAALNLKFLSSPSNAEISTSNAAREAAAISGERAARSPVKKGGEVGGTKPRKRRAGGTKPREKRGGGGCSERCLEKETATVMDMSTATLVLVPSRANVAKFTGTHRHHRHRRRECRRDDEHAQLLRPTTAATTNCLRTPTYPYVHLRSPTYSSHHSPHFVLLPAEPAPRNRWRREAPTRRTSGRHEAPRQTIPTTPQPPPGPKPLSWDAEVGAGGDDLHNASGHLG